MRVGFATVDWSPTVVNSSGYPAMGGSGWIRIGQYLPHLTVDHAIGAPAWNVTKGLYGVQDWLSKKIDFDFDVIVMQRNMHESVAQNNVVARQNGQVVINDLDDWYWGLSHYNFAHERTSARNNVASNRDHYKKALRSSSAVITSTPRLTELVQDINSRSYLLQNYVEIEKYAKVRKQHANHDDVRVGWVGSTGHRSGDFRDLVGLGDMFKWYHGGDAPNMGAPLFAHEIKADPQNVKVDPLVPDWLYPEFFTKFDVGIVPLADIEFNQCKSWIKGLEYAAAGIPFVAAKSREYVRLQEEYGIGIIAKTKKDWIKHLKRLVADADLRQEIADQNWTRLQPLDVKNGAKLYDEMLIQACASANVPTDLKQKRLFEEVVDGTFAEPPEKGNL